MTDSGERPRGPDAAEELLAGTGRRVLGGAVHPRDVTPTDDEVTRGGAPLGAERVTLAIGSVRLALVGLDVRVADLARAHYRAFVASSPESAAPVTSAVEVLRSPRAAWLHLSRGGPVAEEARVFCRSVPSGIVLWSYSFAGWMARDASAGRLLLCDAPDDPTSQALENYLRFLVATAAVARGGFLLHAAGVIRGGRSFLFFGPSGAGKSTTASHAPADSVPLGDDLVLVERGEAGFRACGVPFRGTFQGPDNANASAPIARACRIFQAPANRLEQAPRLVQVAEVLGEVPFLADDAALHDLAAVNVEAFVRAVRVERLHLRRDGTYWALLG